MIRLCSLMIFTSSLPTALFRSSPLAFAASSSLATDSSESAIATLRIVFGQAVIVARMRNGDAQQPLPLVDGADDRRAEDQELHVVVRRVARAQKVVAELVGQRPVDVLAGSVDARERLLVQKRRQAVLRRDLL